MLKKIEHLLFRDELALKRWQRFKRHRVAVFSLIVLILMSLASLLAPLWINNKPILMSFKGQIYWPALRNYHPADFGLEDQLVVDYRELTKNPQVDWAIWPIVPWDPFESNPHVDVYPAAPSKDNWLGTDDRGRDVLARLVYGYRYSMGYALGVWFLSYLVGTLLGGLMGYFGGWLDLVGSRWVEIVESLPVTLLLITLISIFSPNLFWLIVFSVIFDWTGIFHHMRAQFLQWRKREFVEAAKALGQNHLKIMFKHILPNALTPLITFSPFNIAHNIYALTMLDYLGLGLPAPTPSWGELFAQAQKYVTTAQWLVWGPTVATVLTMTALINIGLAVRDVFDSRSSLT